MAIEVLKPLQVYKAGAGRYSDGGGLSLIVRGASSTWEYRYTAATGRQRYMGLGTAERSSIAVAADSLTRARKSAAEARELRRKGIDPIAHRKAQRQAEREAAEVSRRERTEARETLRRFARRYHKANIETTKTAKHAAQWINSIEQHLPAKLLDMPISRVETQELLEALVPVCRQVPETGSRIFQRLCVLFDAAIIDRLCATNPAAPIRKELARRAGERKRGEFAHMPYAQLPAFIQELRAAEGTAARCLEFLILTGARTKEALGATWDEIDLEARTWTIPAVRMKAGEEHVVYLADRAVEILQRQRGQHPEYVFPSVVGADGPQSNMALTMVLRRLGAGAVTTHGFRKSFSTWANEGGYARPDVIEACLAHKEQDRIRRAYNKARFIAERRTLLAAWADFLSRESMNQLSGPPKAVTEAATKERRAGRMPASGADRVDGPAGA